MSFIEQQKRKIAAMYGIKTVPVVIADIQKSELDNQFSGVEKPNFIGANIHEHQRNQNSHLLKSFKGSSSEDYFEKGKKSPIGTVTNGYKKIAEGKWQKVSERGMTKKEHLDESLKIGKQVDSAKSVNERRRISERISRDIITHNKIARELDDKEYDDDHVEGKSGASGKDTFMTPQNTERNPNDNSKKNAEIARRNVERELKQLEDEDVHVESSGKYKKEKFGRPTKEDLQEYFQKHGKHLDSSTKSLIHRDEYETTVSKNQFGRLSMEIKHKEKGHTSYSGPVDEKSELYQKNKHLLGEESKKSEEAKKQVSSDLEKAFSILSESSFSNQIEKGGKRATIGEVRTYGGQKWVKHSDGWVHVTDKGKTKLHANDGKMSEGTEDHTKHFNTHVERHGRESNKTSIDSILEKKPHLVTFATFANSYSEKGDKVEFYHKDGSVLNSTLKTSEDLEDMKKIADTKEGEKVLPEESPDGSESNNQTDEADNKETDTKITVKLVGENGNIFNLLGIVGKEMKRAKQGDKLKELQTKVFASGSYDEALSIIQQYVNVE